MIERRPAAGGQPDPPSRPNAESRGQVVLPHLVGHGHALAVAMILPATDLGLDDAARHRARHASCDCAPRQPDSRSPG